jgi:hypothetical protein
MMFSVNRTVAVLRSRNKPNFKKNMTRARRLRWSRSLGSGPFSTSDPSGEGRGRVSAFTGAGGAGRLEGDGPGTLIAVAHFGQSRVVPARSSPRVNRTEQPGLGQMTMRATVGHSGNRADENGEDYAAGAIVRLTLNPCQGAG